MLTLQNFDNQISGSILDRGKQYYKAGAILEIEETNDGLWHAEVEGSEFYSVEIQVHKNNTIGECLCDCPYDGDICKHVIAVLYAIREEKTIPIDAAKAKAPKKLSFEGLLAKISLKEYKEFAKKYASQNKDFKTALELAFADKDDTIDFGKKYTDALKRIIHKHSDNGFVGYRGSFALSNDISNLLANAEDLLQKENFRDAFVIVTAVLKEMMDVITYCDDSNGNIGGTISETITLFGNIADSAPVSLKEEVFSFLLTELNNKVYYEYGDFGYEMFEVLERLATDLSKSEEFLNYIDTQVLQLTGKYDDYRKNFFNTRKIEFFKATGNNAEVEKLIQQNIEIVEVRQGEVNKFIDKKDFVNAKTLIKDGIAVAKKKEHPGTAAQWEKELLRIAVLENDIKLIRHYARYFAFDRGFIKQYYNQWKATFSADEWIGTIENHIDETIKRIIKDHERNKGKFWYNPNPPILSEIAPVYIEEGFWDRLLELVKKETDLDVILQYNSFLSKYYPAELLAIYLPAFELSGDKASARNQYADLVRKMKKVIKDMPQFKTQIVAVAARLKSKYPRRPAMIDELNTILR